MKAFWVVYLIVIFSVSVVSGAVTAQSQSEILAVAWSHDGDVLATGHRDGRIRLYDSQTGQLNTILQVHTGQVLSLAWNSDGTRLVSGSRDETIIVWDILRRQTIVSGRAIATLNQHDDAQDVVWSPDDSYLISVGGFENMRIWDTSSWEEWANYPLGASFQIAFDPTNPQRLLVPNVFGEVYIVDTASFEIVQTLSSYSDDSARHLYSVAWNSQGTQVATGSLGGIVQIWDISTGQLLFELQGNEGEVVDWGESSIQGLAFSPNDRLLTSISADGTLRTWDTATGTIIETTQLDGPIYAAEWSPDSSQIAYGGSSGTVIIIPAPTID